MREQYEKSDQTCRINVGKCVKIVELPIIKTPRVLPRFRCGSKSLSVQTTNFYNNPERNAKLSKGNMNNVNFRNCFAKWHELSPNAKAYKDKGPFQSLLDCLLDMGLARYVHFSSAYKDNRDGIDENIRFFLLSILTHLNPVPPQELPDDPDKNPDELLTSGETGLRNAFTLPNSSYPDFDQTAEFLFDRVPNFFLSYGGEPRQHGKFHPERQAMLNLQEYVTTSPMQLNASFLNAADHSESHACNCGNSPIIYAFEGIPNNALPQKKFLNGNKFYGVADKPLNTWVMHLGYSWQNNVGNIDDELSIGLYIPGNPSYSKGFSIIERDFLKPTTTIPDIALTDGDLAKRYYMDTQAPRPEHLVNELQFVSPEGRELPNQIETEEKDAQINKAYSGNGQIFDVREINFHYGSCMRFPYGQVSRMELEPSEQSYFYGRGDVVETAAVDNIFDNTPSTSNHC